MSRAFHAELTVALLRPKRTLLDDIYTYDDSGRTTAVTAPDGASTTHTSYSGNNTTVTDPAGMWKTSTSDTFGNLTLMTEPNPAGGANWTASYTYSALNQLTQVSMTRPQGTQTRTFSYTGTDLTSETNPENGTVTYTYDNAHNLMSKTDAIGQKTVYTRDAYARVPRRFSTTYGRAARSWRT
jgi:YD repeat-containing protein